jgi:hypothetical protein
MSSSFTPTPRAFGTLSAPEEGLAVGDDLTP